MGGEVLDILYFIYNVYTLKYIQYIGYIIDECGGLPGGDDAQEIPLDGPHVHRFPGRTGVHVLRTRRRRWRLLWFWRCLMGRFNSTCISTSISTGTVSTSLGFCASCLGTLSLSLTGLEHSLEIHIHNPDQLHTPTPTTPTTAIATTSTTLEHSQLVWRQSQGTLLR